MKFLLQTIKKKLVHDFTFELSRCEEFHKWIGDPITLRYFEGMDFSQIKQPDTYVPVGSVEFVSNYLKTFYPEAEKALIPLNVPEQLFPFAGRKIANIKTKEDLKLFLDDGLVFAKSMDIIKHPDNGFKAVPKSNIDFLGSSPLINTQISTSIELVSEWRVFVFNGQVLDCRNYIGNWFAYPDEFAIKEMVKTYTDAPKTYTLDVGVTIDNKTVVIECHRFFSCGLYGFSIPALYPAMLSQEWFEMKQIR